MINIVAIGKKHEPWLVEGIERYQKRLKAPFNRMDYVAKLTAKSGYGC